MDRPTAELLDGGKRALRAGNWPEARSLLEAAAEKERTPECLEALGQLLYFQGDYDAAIEYRAEAYSGFRARGDDRSAATVACWISYMHAMVYANDAASSGWLERGRSLIEPDVDCPEQGLVLLFSAYYSSDPGQKRTLIRKAMDIARRFNDANLEFMARNDEGMLLIEEGHVAEGMVLLDEAVTAASNGDVADPEFASVIFCSMLRACELALDTRRAGQWMAAQTALAERKGVSHLTNVHCRTYYSGVLTAAGRWKEAEQELEWLTRAYTDRYLGFSAGATVRLADLRVLQGRLEDAESLLAGFEDDPQAIGAFARLHLAREEFDIAAARLRRHLERFGDGVLQAPALALLAEVEAEAGRFDEARRCCARLSELRDQSRHRLVRTLAEFAEGTVCCASGTADATGHLERALSGFVELGLPYDEARTRLLLAQHLADTSPQVALAEARTALDRFETLDARREADESARLLRRLGDSGRRRPRSGVTLTQRETEVLGLLAEGLTNESIADRLYISRRTAEHHVSNILGKLGLHSRAEAVAYALRSMQREGDRPEHKS